MVNRQYIEKQIGAIVRFPRNNNWATISDDSVLASNYIQIV